MDIQYVCRPFNAWNYIAWLEYVKILQCKHALLSVICMKPTDAMNMYF